MAPKSSGLLKSEFNNWKSAIESLPNVRPIAEDNLHYLQTLLLHCSDEDSYLTSPVYYAFTGRRGLWVYESGGEFVLFCLHPNTEDQLIIFPQTSTTHRVLIRELLLLLPMPPKGIRIARVKHNHLTDLIGTISTNNNLMTSPCQEDVLDWKYPVHILSTAKVSGLKGQRFVKIRNSLHQLKHLSLKALPFNYIAQSKSIENLLHLWVSDNAKDNEEYENLYSPYENLFALSLDKSANLNGLTVIVDGVLQATSLWDVSNEANKTANLFVSISNTTIRGLSEFLIIKSCEVLQKQGIEFLNIGGSEWNGLDNYKRKFRPINSIELCSIDVQKNSIVHIHPLSEGFLYA